NGLYWMSLYDGTGHRVDSVPDVLAKDTSDPRSDGVLQPCISCYRCHKEDGLRPFEDQTTKTGKLSVQADYAGKVAGFYNQGVLSLHVANDRRFFANAIHEAVGATWSEFLPMLVAEFSRHAYEPVDEDTAVREAAITQDQWELGLRITQDPVILILSGGGRVVRQQWESSLPEAYGYEKLGKNDDNGCSSGPSGGAADQGESVGGQPEEGGPAAKPSPSPAGGSSEPDPADRGADS
ncbi:MAG: hypothetical protein ACC645_23275, partial [Pirellulales bacterium]